MNLFDCVKCAKYKKYIDKCIIKCYILSTRKRGRVYNECKCKQKAESGKQMELYKEELAALYYFPSACGSPNFYLQVYTNGRHFNCI